MEILMMLKRNNYYLLFSNHMFVYIKNCMIKTLGTTNNSSKIPQMLCLGHTNGVNFEVFLTIEHIFIF